MEPKQVIVVRTDLKMPMGKVGAQIAHASMKVFFDRIAPDRSGLLDPPTGGEMDAEICILTTRPMWDWATNEAFAKICVVARSEEELLEVYEKAQKAGIPSALIEDIGRTVFKGVPTKTCCAIGPDDPSKIDPITGHMRLL